jgi:hypothetical protein
VDPEAGEPMPGDELAPAHAPFEHVPPDDLVAALGPEDEAVILSMSGLLHSGVKQHP